VRIGLDARPAAEIKGGRGRYVRELLAGLSAGPADHDFLLYARRRWEGADLTDGMRWRIVAGREPAWNLRQARAAAREADVQLVTDSFLSGLVLRIPFALVVHDLVPFDRSTGLPLREVLRQRATMGRAIARAAAVVCVSETTRNELVERWPEAGSKSSVVLHGADPRYRPEAGDGDAQALRRHGLDGPYLLSVGTIEPRKNLPRLIEAFTSLPAQARGEHRLALAGAVGWGEDETLRAAAGGAGLVRPLGHVPEDDLPALYRGATALCYPSLREGFGLPVLEAMRSGTPVLTSAVSSLPEVAGDAAEYADPLSVGSIRDGLARLLSDPARRRELSALGLERGARFDRARTAAETLAILERVGS
jgi:alpha-1,3-rhamnosyl/mannosyltransferase